MDVNGPGPLGHDDEPSPDEINPDEPAAAGAGAAAAPADGLNLTPREAPASAPAKGGSGNRGRKIGVLAVLALILVAVGFIFSQALSSAATYYYNADEAVAKKASLGAKTIRVQGTVTKASKQEADGTTHFTIAFNGKTIAVVHRGDTPALFKVGLPIVTQGHWNGSTFASDQIEIKHSASYTEQHPDRVSSGAP